ncbi:hypothetical protein J2S04_000762 [Alicyclobacillus tengchongensis]|uniref:Major facilitator superfamily (MFS) profile domain-containing protein n=1 Tax=Alicyclobacillus tolerans TaxID=90970 RepID=A0ABT9LU94_9BACL|nr:hypothetical protein [Alicyclobacillus tengchongensis]
MIFKTIPHITKTFMKHYKEINSKIRFQLLSKFVVSKTRFSTYPFTAIYFRDVLHYSPIKIRFLFGLPSLGSAILGLLVGSMMDFIGNELGFLCGLVIASISIEGVWTSSSLCILAVMSGMS